MQNGIRLFGAIALSAMSTSCTHRMADHVSLVRFPVEMRDNITAGQIDLFVQNSTGADVCLLSSRWPVSGVLTNDNHEVYVEIGSERFFPNIDDGYCANCGGTLILRNKSTTSHITYSNLNIPERLQSSVKVLHLDVFGYRKIPGVPC